MHYLHFDNLAKDSVYLVPLRIGAGPLRWVARDVNGTQFESIFTTPEIAAVLFDSHGLKVVSLH